MWSVFEHVTGISEVYFSHPTGLRSTASTSFNYSGFPDSHLTSWNESGDLLQFSTLISSCSFRSFLLDLFLRFLRWEATGQSWWGFSWSDCEVMDRWPQTKGWKKIVPEKEGLQNSWSLVQRCFRKCGWLSSNVVVCHQPPWLFVIKWCQPPCRALQISAGHAVSFGSCLRVTAERICGLGYPPSDQWLIVFRHWNR